MKKTLFISVLTLITFASFAQSVSISPDNLQIPRVSGLPACAAADYGKIVFLTTTNRANVCSGSGWIEVAAGGGGGGSLTLPYNGVGSFAAAGLTVMNTGGGLNSAGIQGMTTSALNGANGVLGNSFETTPTGNNSGVRGVNSSTNTFGYGMYGSHAGGGAGVYGESAFGKGIYGSSSGAGDGVSGYVNHANGRAGVFINNSGGNALTTFGLLQFQGNNAANGRFLKSTDNFGTSVWASLTRNEILKLGPAAFYSHISTNESTMGSRGISMTTAIGSFHANVSLPDGATITGMKVYYIDNDGVSPGTGIGLTNWALQKMVHSGSGAYSSLVGISIPNIPANTTIQSLSHTFTSPEVVNNATTLYRMVVTMPASLNLILVGAEIRYTYEVTN